jgi:hypothetical protein
LALETKKLPWGTEVVTSQYEAPVSGFPDGRYTARVDFEDARGKPLGHAAHSFRTFHETYGGGPVHPMVEVSAIELAQANDALRMLGPLKYKGGIRLRSPNPVFSGFSGVVVRDEGRRLVAVSDSGLWLDLELQYSEDGSLKSASDWTLQAMKNPEGAPLLEEPWRNAECLALDGDQLIVGFEVLDRLWRYPAQNTAAVSIPLPEAATAGIPPGYGFSSVTVLPDHSVVAFTELVKDQKGRLRGWLVAPTATASGPVFYWQHGKLLGMETLPNGDVALLEHGWSRADGNIISRMQGSTIRAGSVLESEPIAHIAPPLLDVDLQGIAARRDAQGRTILYLMSDSGSEEGTAILLFEWAQ